MASCCESVCAALQSTAPHPLIHDTLSGTVLGAIPAPSTAHVGFCRIRHTGDQLLSETVRNAVVQLTCIRITMPASHKLVCTDLFVLEVSQI
ncbi:hypothetical protein CEP52_001219 [Fusarium oligoseptatum]|uniref:Uncharacterized protein n=1 Tax=Fusarium oligoseptatum TaxID=2604345 RepID=A0A428UK04_9HYPO|nr:hypothetical protein CEP52_001219 [Fusarium oligoseptatum]